MKVEGGQTVKITLENPREVLLLQLAIRRDLRRAMGETPIPDLRSSATFNKEFNEELLRKMEDALQ